MDITDRIPIVEEDGVPIGVLLQINEVVRIVDMARPNVSYILCQVVQAPIF